MNISASQINILINYPEIIHKLRINFAAKYNTIPERQNHNLPNGNTSLIMPAWNQDYYGIKQIIACPENPQRDLPIIQGKYDLYDARIGTHLASVDAQKLTAVRTAATSVLASSFFTSNPEKLVIMGNGVIAHHLKDAYQAFYGIEHVVMWSRSLKGNIDLEKEVKDADIISCATHAYEPILKGKWISGTPHIDLVGSYKPHMREADDDLIKSATLYVDDWPTLEESGDLKIPITRGIIKKEDISATLFKLCSGINLPHPENKPTLFKSAGHALEDLITAIYFYELYR